MSEASCKTNHLVLTHSRHSISLGAVQQLAQIRWFPSVPELTPSFDKQIKELKKQFTAQMVVAI